MPKVSNPRSIRYETVPGHVVSTVELFARHPGGYFETMVFRADGEEITDWREVQCRRYETEDEALVGHASIVEEWRSKQS